MTSVTNQGEFDRGGFLKALGGQIASYVGAWAMEHIVNEHKQLNRFVWFLRYL